MPYIISGMVMIAMFYVMMFLNNSKGLGKVPGAEILVDIMGLGCGIIAIFSYIFLFYTNSFINQKAQERGRNIQYSWHGKTSYRESFDN